MKFDFNIGFVKKTDERPSEGKASSLGPVVMRGCCPEEFGWSVVYRSGRRGVVWINKKLARQTPECS